MEELLVIEKKQLREKMRSLNQSVDWDAISIDVLKNLRKHSTQFAKKSIIGAYWPMEGEIDILPFLEECCLQGGIACLPFIARSQLPLVFYPWTPGVEMEIGRYKIPIPKQREKIILPDILLTPLLAFDNMGHRLGRGGGFYDRTIHELRRRKNICVIGLGSEHQRVSSVPFDNYDKKLDCVITNEGIYSF